jgi:NADH:ubiquinone oxidoreductase subunit
MMWGLYVRTLFKGKYVGCDTEGNRYYRCRGRGWDKAEGFVELGGKSLRLQEKRWVLYKGSPNPTIVPPLWEDWLRYERLLPPPPLAFGFFWEKPRLPNLSGTKLAFHFHPGMTKNKKDRGRWTYCPWQPEGAAPGPVILEKLRKVS